MKKKEDKKPINISIGLEMREFRLRIGMAVEEMAKRTGHTTQNLLRMENGYHSFTPDTVNQIIRIGMEKGILFKGIKGVYNVKCPKCKRARFSESSEDSTCHQCNSINTHCELRREKTSATTH